MTMESFIKVSKVWTEGNIHNSNKRLLNVYGEMGFAFYIYCKFNEVAYIDGCHININDFLDIFGFAHRATRKKKRDDLLSIIKSMEENGIITFYSNLAFMDIVKFDVDCNLNRVMYCNVEKFNDTNFIKLTRFEFVNIMKSESNRLELLVHFMSIMHYENNLEQVCYPSLEGLYNITGYAKNTCIRYNDMLRDLQVLYFDNAGMEYDTSNQQFKQKTNTYGRWVNKDIVDDKVVEIRLRNEGKLYNISGEKQELTNRSRSLSNKMMYVKDEEELAMLKTEYDAIIERKTKMESINYAHMIPKSLRGKAGACDGTKDNDSVVM